MFGTNQNTSIFGGQNKSTTFGTGSSLFGSGTGGFGSPSPFGATTPAPGANTSIFGGASTAPNVFGTNTSTVFGQTSNAGTGGFSFGGTTQPAGGGLFGQNTAANTSASLFGTPATSAFGAKTPAFGGTTGAFGSTPAAGGLFGNTTSFGATNTATSSLFGGFGAASQQPQQPQQPGTTVKFNPPPNTDTMVKNGTTQNISTRHQCITAMKEYENKSLEELRAEDYAANRKGPQAGSITSAGLFGGGVSQSDSTAFGGFGAANKSTGFGFGSAASSGGLFGSTQTPAQASTSLFGASKPSLFGTPATTTAAASSLFGAAQPNTFSFGATNPLQNKGLFGAPATTQSGGLFGTSAPAATAGAFSFGSNTAQPAGGLFGAKTNTPFGATPATGGVTFGQASTSGSIFGKPAAATNSFGFGATNTGTAFGQTQPSSLFGNKPAALGLTGGFGGTGTGFGSAGTGFGLGTGGLNTGSSLFSAQPNKLAFGFGGSTTAPAGTGLGTGFGGLGTGTTSAFNFGATGAQANPTQAGAEAAQQQNLLQQQLQALVQSPYGDSPLFRNLKNDERRDEILRPTNPSAQKASLNEASLKIGSISNNRVKPRPLHAVGANKGNLFDGLEDADSAYGIDTFVCRKSVKKLVIRPTVPLQRSDVDSDGRRSPLNRNSMGERTNGLADHDQEDVIRGQRNLSEFPASPDRNPLENTMNILNNNRPAHKAHGALTNRIKMPTNSADTTTQSSVLDSDDDEADDEGRETPPLHPAGVVLNRVGYYTIPSLDELRDVLDENGDCFVRDLTVGREGYGNVFFPGITNVAGLNLDVIVHFRRKEITVYPDDERKPPVGEGLNKKAEVTLDCVWPNDKSTQSPIKSLERLKAMNYTAKIEAATAKIGAKFIDYRPETGSWVFEVKHFSKYGLLDDSDDENNHYPEKDPKKLKLLMEKTQDQQRIQRQQINLSMEQDGPENELKMLQLIKQQENGDVELINNKHLDNQHSSQDDDADMIADINRENLASTRMEEEEEEEEEEEDDDNLVVTGSSHRLAAELGVNAHSMQVMKASFFGEVELELAHSEPYLPAFARSRPRTPIYDILDGKRTPTGLLSARHQQAPSEQTKIRVAQPMSFTSGLLSQRALAPTAHHAASDVQRAPVPRPELHHRPVSFTDLCLTAVPLARSLLYRKHDLVMDGACYRNRAERVGWTRQLTFVHSLRRSKDARKPRSSGLLPSSGQRDAASATGQSIYHTDICRLRLTAAPVSKEHIVKCLEINLDHCQKTILDGCPKLTPRAGVAALHQYSALFRDDLKASDAVDDYIRNSSRVWDLCVALWGVMPGYDTDLDETSYEYQMARRAAFQRWLSETIQNETGSEVHQEDDLSAILRFLCAQQIAEACERAARAADYHLSLLLAQASSGRLVANMVEKQVSNWKESQTDDFIEPQRLKIYALLARVLVWRSTSFSINTCEDLTWKQALAVHLHYQCEPNASLSDAFGAYQTAFKGGPNSPPYSRPPLPDYLHEMHPTEADVLKIRDTCYHLIKLYTKCSHRLERTLAPTTSTADHLDYRLSWHLLQVLSAVGYTHMGAEHVNALHANFASQLEACGLWHWAVFVLLHLNDGASRELTVREMLMRNVGQSDDDVISFLTEKLSIPPQWIHQAKAVYAAAAGRRDDEAWHYLQAGMYNRSHDIVTEHLAADCIINEHYSSLSRYLERLHEHNQHIHNWAQAGGIFYDFIRLNRQIRKLRQGKPSLYDLETLQPDAVSLTERVGKLRCRHAKDRLCQSEIAKRTANLLQLLVQSHSMGDALTTSVSSLAPHIGNLPLPEDYSLQLLRGLTESYITELTS